MYKLRAKQINYQLQVSRQTEHSQAVGTVEPGTTPGRAVFRRLKQTRPGWGLSQPRYKRKHKEPGPIAQSLQSVTDLPLEAHQRHNSRRGQADLEAVPCDLVHSLNNAGCSTADAATFPDLPPPGGKTRTVLSRQNVYTSFEIKRVS